MESVTSDHETELAELAGHLNAVHARLVGVVADVLATDAWTGPGIHSPAQWVAWKTGVSPERARDIVKVARRRADFPAVIGAFGAGELSLEQTAVVVATAPAWADRDVLDIAKLATVGQLRRVMRSGRFVGAPDEAAEPARSDRERLATRVTDEGRWRINGELDLDRGMTVDAALDHAREDLFQESGGGEISGADCLAHVCRRYLDGIAAPVRRDRAKVWIHLDVTDGSATSTDGWSLPTAIRDHLLCDGVVQPVWEREGLPFSVGRTQRIVPDRTRRIVRRRDRGCRVPGCTNDRSLEIHHIIHWLRRGPTDTCNLLSLCPKHHRLHHRGELGIAGDADLPGGVVFTDAGGRVIEPVGRPVAPTRPPPAPELPYQPPYGGRLDHDWIGLGWIHPTELARRRSRWRTEPPAA